VSLISLFSSLLSQNLTLLPRTTMAATNGHTNQIPVINLSGPEAEVAKQLVDAAATYGFVYVKSLGKDIPVEDIDSIFAMVTSQQDILLCIILMFAQSKEFFSSPIEEKEACKIQENV
jgi:hypothetical protein